MWSNSVKISITLDFYDVITAYSAATVNNFCKRKISLRLLSKSMIPGMRNPEFLLGIMEEVSRTKMDWIILMVLAFHLDQKRSDFLINNLR